MIANAEFMFKAVRSEDSYIPMHRHRCYEIVYYGRGTGFTRIGNKRYEYKPGTYSLIRPDSDHDESRSEETDVLCAGFRFSGEGLPELEQGVFSDDANRTVEILLADMLAEMTEKPDHFAIRLDLCMSEIVVKHLRAYGKSASELKEDSLNFVRNYIHEHFNEDIQIEILASMSGYSYHRFRHLFKSRYGKSPMSYVLKKKIDYALKLLGQSDMPVSTVASLSGFSNAAQFSMLFKRECGVTPLQYRKSSSANPNPIT